MVTLIDFGCTVYWTQLRVYAIYVSMAIKRFSLGREIQHFPLFPAQVEALYT